MLVRAINAVNEAHEFVDKIIVTSDDPEILVCANKHGANPVVRPPELATDTARIDEAVVHATIEVYGEYPPPMCLIIQPNVPIWKKGTVQRAITAMSDGALTGCVTAVKASHPPEWLMKRKPNGTLGFYMGDGEGVPVNRQELDTPYFIDGQLVACLSATLLGDFPRKPLGVCGEKIGLLEREPVFGTDIDNRMDYVTAEALLAEMPEQV
jgi:CMP-N-acetylneuraminic acid synthetase